MNYMNCTPKRKIVLVVGSRHGSTAGIGNVLSDSLKREGFEVDQYQPDELVHVEDYDAAILGSAIYNGTWLPEMKEFAGDYEFELTKMPVYLFSAGPVGWREQSNDGGIDVEQIVHRLHPIEHKVFHGSLDRHSLSALERLRARITHAPEGDERDWGNIIAWARHLGNEFRKLPIRSPYFYV